MGIANNVSDVLLIICVSNPLRFDGNVIVESELDGILLVSNPLRFDGNIAQNEIKLRSVSSFKSTSV